MANTAYEIYRNSTTEESENLLLDSIKTFSMTFRVVTNSQGSVQNGMSVQNENAYRSDGLQ